jgi:hypothetical protein
MLRLRVSIESPVASTVVNTAVIAALPSSFRLMVKRKAETWSSTKVRARAPPAKVRSRSKVRRVRFISVSYEGHESHAHVKVLNVHTPVVSA